MSLVPGYEYPVEFALDFRVALEAVLVQRLRQQPTTRRQEWLRRLLVLGFRQECQSLQQAADQAARPSAGAALAQWLTPECVANDVDADKPKQLAVEVGHAHQKPLAALQKVLGGKVA